MEQDQRIIRRLLIVIGLAVILFIGWQVFLLVRHRGMGKLVVQSAPSDLRLVLGSKVVNNNATLYVTPGTYSWTATRAHFGTRNGTITVKKGSGNQPLIVFLEPSDAAGTQYLKDHPEEARKIEGLVGARTEQVSQQAQDAQPLIKQLPFIGPAFEYRIDYGTTPANAKYKNQPGIYIGADSDQGKQDALDWIKAQGFDPNRMNIVYQTIEEATGTTPVTSSTAPPSGDQGQ